MKSRCLASRLLPGNWVILPVLVLLIFTRFMSAQANFSSGPLLLHQVRTIYVVPSSDDFARMIKARLEIWETVAIVSKPEDADAILTCQTVTTLVPAKVPVRQTIAEVALVDRRFQKPIWTTSKSVAFDRAVLADDIVAQLKQDWRKSASAY